MYRILIILSALSATLELRAQGSIDSILQQIEDNNPTLSALRKATEATKIGNHTGIALDDPEVDFAYLWGSPRSVGNRKNIEVSQSFDMATLTGAKRRMAKEQDTMADYQYKLDRQEILLNARQLCIDIIYYNAMHNNLATRLEYAEQNAKSQKQRLDKGEGTQVEYNTTMMELTTAKVALKNNDTERDAALLLLQSLNGGNAISLTTADFPVVSIPADFKSWYAEAETKSPALAYARQEAEVATRQVAITRADGMPKLTAGFTGEYINDENLSGFSIGMTIPLWSNKNKEKQAKAEAVAAKAKAADAKLQFYYNLQSLYQRQAGLHEMAEAYNQTVSTTDNIQLLKKALDEGAINIISYTADLRTYYELKAQQLDANRSWHKAVAEMMAVVMP